MFTRKTDTPSDSFFLFGPRATGKSTWLKHNFNEVLTYNLLKQSELLRLSRDPETLGRETAGLPKGDWVIIDEVQKVPALLDEVHRLIEERGLRFILSGSSARKLKRGASNLLAGRAAIRHLFPLVSAEMNHDYNTSEVIRFGTLPLTITGSDAVEYLNAYSETYLREEVMAEALTRNIGGFSRFLEIAARQNAQTTNTASIARDAGVSRQTVANYFEILCDTLIGYWLTPWKLKLSTKQVVHPKFYLFDSGVTRALSGRLPYPPTQEEYGALLETFILNELRAYIEYNRLHYKLHFWKTYDGTEVDVLLETAEGYCAIEIKATPTWNKRFNRGLRRLKTEMEPNKVNCFGIYRGDRNAIWDDISIFPIEEFLKRLWAGEIIQ